LSDTCSEAISCCSAAENEKSGGEIKYKVAWLASRENLWGVGFKTCGMLFNDKHIHTELNVAEAVSDDPYLNDKDNEKENHTNQYLCDVAEQRIEALIRRRRELEEEYI